MVSQGQHYEETSLLGNKEQIPRFRETERVSHKEPQFLSRYLRQHVGGKKDTV